ncbi:MAG TPA: carboxypeptidase-like regulatory domain-containing protein [Vicinamibacterales bacterium]|nr:carboxypeptidase-like regulatory domain-containing protein [Vicinamibacterales bacterium]
MKPLIVLAAVAAAACTAFAQTSTTTVAVNGTAAAAAQGAQNGQTPARDNRPQTGAGVVRGRIVSDTGQPLRRIVVQLQGTTTPRATTTDTDGHYEFTNLPAGHFNISAGHTGYITTRSDGFDLADNQRIDNMSMRVPHGGVITGQILDEFGEPFTGATVVPMRQQYVNGRRRVQGAGQSATTNDIGEYRLFGLQPGSYYVSVTPRNDSLTVAAPLPPGSNPPAGVAPNLTTTSASSGYGPTYYPGTSDVTGAQIINVSAAQTVSGISFSLSSVRLARITGVVFDDQGRPVTRGAVMLMSRGTAGQFGGIGNNGPMRQDGSFTLTNVPPGSYYVRATIQPPGPVAPPTPGNPPTPPQTAIAAITVMGDDISGIVLTPTRPAIIRGRVSFDDAGAAASINPSTVRILAQRLDVGGPALVGVPANATVKDDFTFEIPASPELSLFRANVPPSTRGPGDMAMWRLRAVYVRGQDVTDTGVELQAGSTLDDVEIAMTTRVQTVSGTVAMTDGSPAKNMSVIMFPVERDRWTAASSRYIGRANTGTDGTFKVLSLPPGEYFALSVPSNLSPAPDWNDPDVLEAASRNASRFSIGEGGSATLDLKVSR